MASVVSSTGGDSVLRRGYRKPAQIAASVAVMREAVPEVYPKLFDVNHASSYPLRFTPLHDVSFAS